MIRVTELVKRYDQTEALRGISFSVAPGQICGYLGPNGAGKSTTVQILTGVLKPTSGQAECAGFDVVAQPLEVKRRIGYVPENAAVFSTLTVQEHLNFIGALHHMPAPVLRERCGWLLELFGIASLGGRRLDTLSKGQRQRVILSAAFLPDPEVLILDEPMTGLDAHGALSLKEAVASLARKGRTVLYCSHILEVVERLCDRLVIIDQGQIVADGNTQDLLSGSGSSLEALFRQLTGSTEATPLLEALIDDDR
ncbi:MAG: ABC transporter ATP-binding protein [Myxococcota bacterium]